MSHAYLKGWSGDLSLLKEGVIWKQNGVVHSMQQLNKLLEIRDDIKGHLSNGDGEKMFSL